MIGRTLGPYEVLELLGRGGMGEVYRARDTRLGREVALKVLPAEASRDGERIARFQREARTLASLQHANIAGLFGIETFEGVTFLVMELAGGDDLAVRLRQGPLAVDDALDVARQIAAGLEEAHEKGIVHRDLKPANVKLAADGRVKILDFGLARAFAGDSLVEGDPALSPTITAAMTAAGTILGTAAYMSPEQARGKRVDRRADIWAFGVVLWEMLTGRRMFEGETTSDTLASVLRAPIELDELPESVPDAVRSLLERCLDRDPATRLRDIGEARLVLGGEKSIVSRASASMREAPEAPPPAHWRALSIAGWSLVLVLAFLLVRASGPAEPSTTPAPSAIHAVLELPSGSRLDLEEEFVEISPDGRTVAVVASDPDDELSSWIFTRTLDRDEYVRVPGTRRGYGPRFSPDGRSLVFGTHERQALFRADLRSGTHERIGPHVQFGATWVTEDSLAVCSAYTSPITVMSVTTGGQRALTRIDPDSKVLGHWYPDTVDGTEWVLYTAYSSPADSSRVEVVSRRTGEVRVLVHGARYARWSRSGHVLFVRDGQLCARAVDPAAMVATGPTTVMHGPLPMDSVDGFSGYAISDDGTLVFLTREESKRRTRLATITLDGDVQMWKVPERHYSVPRLSPDGQRVAVTVYDDEGDVWVHDRTRGSWTRVSHTPASEFGPVWDVDGDFLYYTAETPSFGIFRVPFGGGATEYVFGGAQDHLVLDSVPGGSELFISINTEDSSIDLHRLVLGPDARTIAWRATAHREGQARVSPDGRWIAYTSNESGTNEVFVEPFEGGGRRWQISVSGGIEPAWSRDASRLFYRHGQGLFSIAVDGGGPAPVFSAPTEHFRVPFATTWYTSNYDVLPDGSGIVAPVDDGAPRRRLLQFVTGFHDQLRRRATAR
jgi:eukaryotic-like serine/threonine-protein kinase